MAKLIALILLIVGFSGFLLPLAIHNGLININDTTELPAADITDIEISSTNEIFLALGPWSRIQKYSPTGAFIKGWKIDSGAGAVCLDISGNEIIAYLPRYDAVNIYSTDGGLIASEIKDYQGAEQIECDTMPYRVTWRGISIDASAPNEKTILIKRRLWHFPYVHALLSVALMFIGLAVMRLSNR